MYTRYCKNKWQKIAKPITEICRREAKIVYVCKWAYPVRVQEPIEQLYTWHQKYFLTPQAQNPRGFASPDCKPTINFQHEKPGQKYTNNQEYFLALTINHHDFLHVPVRNLGKLVLVKFWHIIDPLGMKQSYSWSRINLVLL